MFFNPEANFEQTHSHDNVDGQVVAIDYQSKHDIGCNRYHIPLNHEVSKINDDYAVNGSPVGRVSRHCHHRGHLYGP